MNPKTYESTTTKWSITLRPAAITCNIQLFTHFASIICCEAGLTLTVTYSEDSFNLLIIDSHLKRKKRMSKHYFSTIKQKWQIVIAALPWLYPNIAEFSFFWSLIMNKFLCMQHFTKVCSILSLLLVLNLCSTVKFYACTDWKLYHTSLQMERLKRRHLQWHTSCSLNVITLAIFGVLPDTSNKTPAISCKC